MSTTFNYQILACIEAVYLGCSKPSELDKSNRWSVLFTSFINTTEKVLSPDVTSEVVGDTFAVKLDQGTLQSLLPILKPKTFYRLILGVRDWGLNGRHGMSFRLIDINSISSEESLFKAYLGNLKDIAIDASLPEAPSSEASLSQESSSESLQKFLS